VDAHFWKGVSRIVTPQKQLEAGIRFLLRHQDADGAWRDFRLQPGRSDAWTTAFVALRLLPSALGVLRRPVGNALSLAERFLQNAREPHGGWAYNWRCPTDADSTACALLFLQAVSATVYPKDYAALARFQLENGGFATYQFADSNHAWCVAHPEVTATSLRALSDFLPPDHFRIRNGIAWLSQILSHNRDSAPYWWLSPRYFAIEVRELRRAFPTLPSCRDLPVRHDGYFDLALSLELDASGVAEQERFAELLVAQEDDGGWPSSPILRVPDPRNAIAAATAPVATDDCRLMTTAAAVSALSASKRRRARRREPQPVAALSPPV
jgi:hypothetical protein